MEYDITGGDTHLENFSPLRFSPQYCPFHPSSLPLDPTLGDPGHMLGLWLWHMLGLRRGMLQNMQPDQYLEIRSGSIQVQHLPPVLSPISLSQSNALAIVDLDFFLGGLGAMGYDRFMWATTATNFGVINGGHHIWWPKCRGCARIG